MTLFDRLFEGKASPETFLKGRTDIPVKAYSREYKMPKNIDAMYNKTSPKDPILGGTLGSGGFGRVFPTESGKVVKFDTDEDDSEATLFKSMPKAMKQHPITPQGVEISKFKPEDPGEVRTISREDIKHLDDRDDKAYLKISDLYTKIGKFRRVSPGEIGTQRMLLLNQLLGWHKEVQDSPDLSKSDKVRLKKFGSGMARYFYHGIIPDDLQYGNIGKRDDGTLVLRDLGIYDVMPDEKRRGVYRIKNRNKDLKAKVNPKVIEKLKTLRRS